MYLAEHAAPSSNRARWPLGWAKVLVVGRRFQYYSEFRGLARRAKADRRGAWGLCGGMHVPQ